MPSPEMPQQTLASPSLHVPAKVNTEGERADDEREDEDVDNVVRGGVSQPATGQASSAPAPLQPTRKLRG